MNPTSGICVMIFFLCVFGFGNIAPTPAESYARIINLSEKCHANEGDNKTILEFKVPSTDTGKCLMQCFLKELDMVDLQEKYDEGKSFVAFKDFWSMFPEDILNDVNTAAAGFAKGIESQSGTCEYGYEIMKFINSEFIKRQLITPNKKPDAK